MNQISPRVSVVVPWWNRTDISTTLRTNVPLVKEACGELMVVNCAGNTDELRRLIRDSEAEDVVVAQLDVPHFNKALALNYSIDLCRAPYFFSLDSDVLLSPGLLATALELIANKPAFLTVAWMHESQPRLKTSSLDAMRIYRSDYLTDLAYSTEAEFTFRDRTVVRVAVQRNNVFTDARFGCGLLLARREDLLSVGGYNSELMGWGWEDIDLQVRLRKRLPDHIQFGDVCHLTHGDEARSLNEKDKRYSNRENMARCFDRYSKGDFNGTLQQDRRHWKHCLTNRKDITGAVDTTTRS